MPENFVVFQLNGVDWRLSRVCFTTAGVMFVIGGVLLTLVLRRYGKVRELSEYEAASVSMHAGEVGSVDRAVTRHGYAVGSEVRVSMSIGDLRKAYHEKDWFKFFALPNANMFLWNSAALVMFGFYFAHPETVWLVMALIVSVPATAIVLFMWWAALNTNLE